MKLCHLLKLQDILYNAFFSSEYSELSLSGNLTLNVLAIFFLIDLIIMKFVFLKFIDSLFISHHSFTFKSSWLIRVSNWVALEDEAKIVVLSAKILKERFSEQLGMSLM